MAFRIVAKALGRRLDGYHVIFEFRNDPFWREAILLYAELGDIAALPLSGHPADERLKKRLLVSEIFLDPNDFRSVAVARTFPDEPQLRKSAQLKLCETQCDTLHIQPASRMLALTTM
jgi:hypothetical protein